jgi:hypothetical protein
MYQALHDQRCASGPSVDDLAGRAGMNDGIIAVIVARFENLVGLWTGDPEDH